MIEVREYVADNDRSPFNKWVKKLGAGARAKVIVAITKIKNGHFGDSKTVKGEVREIRIHSHGGLRIYFALDGQNIVILLAGGTKRRQTDDINKASDYWKDYKKRKEDQCL